ncbi:Uncharacterized protein FWK35_00032776 [Aphis craccivora]|uniref:Uncharacterized protein n=1 Tax=Aphis craccivora TaxID=307492 RepID=A0A6G0X9K4_APHCR|nr:Uncharacterized protein FWK35_00032776 [Aphis craccivora]
MDHLLMLVCESPSLAVEDATDDESAVVIGDGRRYDGGGDFVVHTTSLAKGEEVRNSLGDLVGWLDPGVTQHAPRRSRKRLQLAWRSLKRVFRGMLCCCARADVKRPRGRLRLNPFGRKLRMKRRRRYTDKRYRTREDRRKCTDGVGAVSHRRTFSRRSCIARRVHWVVVSSVTDALDLPAVVRVLDFLGSLGKTDDDDDDDVAASLSSDTGKTIPPADDDVGHSFILSCGVPRRLAKRKKIVPRSNNFYW